MRLHDEYQFENPQEEGDFCSESLEVRTHRIVTTIQELNNQIHVKRQCTAESLSVLKEQLRKQQEFSSSFDSQLAPLGFSNQEFVDKIKGKID